VVIARSAMQKFAKAAGVTESEVGWLREPLELMMFNLQCAKSIRARAPSWPNRIEQLRATSSAACALEALLRREWVSVEMKLFESRELKLQMLGSRGGVNVNTRADGKKAKKWMRAASIVEGDVTRDVQAVTRIRSRLSTMIDQFEHAQAEGLLAPPDGAANPIKQHIANCALCWWTRMGRGQKRTKEFKAFADALYQLAGFTMSSPAIHVQLTAAVKRRHANQRSECRI
jgi:hypothetical protein